MPHGYPYQEIPFWFESQFKGLDPSRAELCYVAVQLLANAFILTIELYPSLILQIP